MGGAGGGGDGLHVGSTCHQSFIKRKKKKEKKRNEGKKREKGEGKENALSIIARTNTDPTGQPYRLDFNLQLIFVDRSLGHEELGCGPGVEEGDAGKAPGRVKESVSIRNSERSNIGPGILHPGQRENKI
jgi:hypothetical protein